MTDAWAGCCGCDHKVEQPAQSSTDTDRRSVDVRGCARNIVRIDFVDYGVNGEYGFFGKTVARLDVRGMTEEQIISETAKMQYDLGGFHIVPLEVEEIPPTS